MILSRSIGNGFPLELMNWLLGSIGGQNRRKCNIDLHWRAYIIASLVIIGRNYTYRHMLAIVRLATVIYMD